MVLGAGAIIAAFLTAASLIGLYGYGAMDAIKYFIALIIFGIFSAFSFLIFKEIKSDPERARPETIRNRTGPVIIGVFLIFTVIFISDSIQDYLLNFAWYGGKDIRKFLAIAYLLCIFGLISAASYLKSAKKRLLSIQGSYNEMRNTPRLERLEELWDSAAFLIIVFSLLFTVIFISDSIQDYLLDFAWYGGRASWKILVIAFLLCAVPFNMFFIVLKLLGK